LLRNEHTGFMASAFQVTAGNNHFGKSDALFHSPRVVGGAHVKFYMTYCVAWAHAAQPCSRVRRDPLQPPEPNNQLVLLSIPVPAKSDPAEFIQVGSFVFFEGPGTRNGFGIDVQCLRHAANKRTQLLQLRIQEDVVVHSEESRGVPIFRTSRGDALAILGYRGVSHPYQRGGSLSIRQRRPRCFLAQAAPKDLFCAACKTIPVRLNRRLLDSAGTS